MAHTAVVHLLPHRRDGSGKLRHIVDILAQQMEHQSESCLAADTRQFGEFLYSLLQQLRGIVLTNQFGN
jgi:hypothetical protein